MSGFVMTRLSNRELTSVSRRVSSDEGLSIPGPPFPQGNTGIGTAAAGCADPSTRVDMDLARFLKACKLFRCNHRGRFTTQSFQASFHVLFVFRRWRRRWRLWYVILSILSVFVVDWNIGFIVHKSGGGILVDQKRPLAPFLIPCLVYMAIYTMFGTDTFYNVYTLSIKVA